MPHLDQARARKILNKELAVRCASGGAADLDGAGYSLIDCTTTNPSQTKAFMQAQPSAVTSFGNHFENTCVFLKALCTGHILFMSGGMASDKQVHRHEHHRQLSSIGI